MRLRRHVSALTPRLERSKRSKCVILLTVFSYFQCNIDMRKPTKADEGLDMLGLKYRRVQRLFLVFVVRCFFFVILRSVLDFSKSEAS